ncbi:expansin EXLX1 family cellulose-binding protein [Streptomyces pseudovenezuelae]|uniref:Expansin (Peptidoglycan-binding protein) n=1 Tax=Streptomyces pseudovenezuelae TaxID=67350 RepID=A0ABT6LCK8_9ACTN|nr:expansin EXLX1 family cellulose-binding protein [Streptomyces pseudovenezuelae]MDH6214032.1 expansin (peptidoglycan-binding protein) [Streptomyces pseudovenezuelae]
MTLSSHRRPGGSRRAVLVSAVAVAAVALVASLVMAFHGDREPDSGQVAAAPAASHRTTTSPTASDRPKPSSSSASPSTTAASSPASSPPATTKAPRKPSATRTAQAAAAPAAGRIRPGVTYQGVATSYDIGNGDGACSYGPSGDTMTAAMNHTDYETAKACGAYVRVQAGGVSVTVRITNECPECTPGQIDLSRQAFAKLAALSKGRMSISWSLLSPATSDTVSVRYKTGSSQYWCAVQPIGHRNPVARLEVRAGGTWRQLARTDYNYFLSENGSGCGGALRITDIYGEQLIVDGIAVRPNVVQATGVQFARH